MFKTHSSTYLLSLSLALLSASAISAEYSFAVVGSQTTFSVFNEWFYTYQLLRPEISFTYSAVNTAGSYAALAANTADLVVGVNPMTTAALNALTPAGDALQLPFCGLPYVITYNLPYGNLAYGSSPQLTLTLDRPTFAKIFALQITNWRDPAILALQPPAVAALLPNRTITVAARSDSGAVNNVIQSVAKASLPSWPWGNPSNSWSNTYLNSPNVVKVVQTWGATAAATSLPDSISYVPYPTVLQDPGFTFAKFINKNGDLVDTPQLESAVMAANWSASFGTNDLVDSRAAGAWPFGGPVYLYLRVRNATMASCEARRELFLFLNWITTDPWAVKRMTSMGLSSMGTGSLVQRISQAMKSLTCTPLDSKALLTPLPLSQHSGSGIQGVTILSLIAAIAVVAMVAYYFYRFGKKNSFSANVFYLLLLVGALLNYLGVYYLSLVPDQDSVCQSRIWLIGVGFTLMLSGIFCRANQIRAVHSMAKSASLGNKVSHGIIQVGGNSIILAAQLVLLGAWFALDPFSSVRDETDTLQFTYKYICKSKQPLVWWGLEIAFMSGLLMFGLFVVYRTWDLKHMVKESKWIAISVYNTLVVMAQLIALFSTLSVSDDTVFWLAGCATFCLTTMTMAVMFLPRVLEIRSLSDTSDSSSGSNQSRCNSVSVKGPVSSTMNTVTSKMGQTSKMGTPSSPKRAVTAVRRPSLSAATAPTAEADIALKVIVENGSQTTGAIEPTPIPQANST